MNSYFFLIPISLFFGAVALLAFIWALRHGQYDDLDGASERILPDDDSPIPETSREKRSLD